MRPPPISPNLHLWPMSDGYPLRGRFWPPRAKPPSRAFIYLHGIQSHGAWFAWSAALLAHSGNPVLLPDRRGSGLNDLTRGDTPSPQRWLEDIDELAAWAGREFGVKRFAVVGVSWGGKLATAWTLRRRECLDRLLLIAPGLFPLIDLPRLTKLRVGLSLLGHAHRMFDIPLNDPALFTDNPAGRRFIDRDPHKLAQVSARFLWYSRRLDRRLYRLPPGALNVPTTLILAGRERIICNTRTQAWARRVAGRLLELTTCPHAAHTLEFESDASGFANVLLRWAGIGENRPLTAEFHSSCNQSLFSS